jgi:DNA-binding transcriptional ArsR family regulator
MDEEAQAQAQAQSNICSIFSNPLRILILWAMKEGELSVGEISPVIGASIQNTSQHLRLMKDRAIVSSRREGRNVLYRVHHRSANQCLLNKSPNPIEATVSALKTGHQSN